MALSVTAANKQIERLKKKLAAMKAAAAAPKPPKAPKPTLAAMKRRKAVQARIDAAQAVIADLTEKVDKFKAGESDYKASTIVKMEKRIEKLQAMIASLQKSAKRLTVYNVRLMLNETQVGEFGPYATIRAASADAKNILRMHLGPDNKIEEVGVDEPLLRSDGKILAYFHPSIYTGQQSGGGILTAQVVETGGASERTATFVSSVKKPKKKKPSTSAQTSLLNPRRRVTLTRAEFDAKYWGAEAHTVPERTKREFFADYRESGKSFAAYKKATSTPYPNSRRRRTRRNPGPFATMAQVKAAHAASGGKFFDRGNMKFFASKVEGGPYGGRFFVTSEKTGFTSTSRAFTVRRVSDDGLIRTVGSMGDFATKADAVAHARHLAGQE